MNHDQCVLHRSIVCMRRTNFIFFINIINITMHVNEHFPCKNITLFISGSAIPVRQNIQRTCCRFFPHLSENSRREAVFFANDRSSNRNICPFCCRTHRCNCIFRDFSLSYIPFLLSFMSNFFRESFFTFNTFILSVFVIVLCICSFRI